MKKSLGQQDYHRYEFNRREWTLALGMCAGAVIFLAWFFYRSIWAIPVLAPLGYFLLKEMREQRGARQRLELTEQFKECILSVSASLQAGYAVENAFLESREDMKNLYGTDAMIYQELEGIRRGLVINIPLEEMLLDLGERSGSQEMEQFAKLFAVAKRGGGNLPEMIRTSANLISQKLEVRQEIDTLLSGRKMELKIMDIMPFGIVLYIGSTYENYFAELYHSLSGAAVMSVCLILYLLSVFLGERILQGIWDSVDGKKNGGGLPILEQKGIMAVLAGKGEILMRRILGTLPKVTVGKENRRYLEMLYPQEPREELVIRYYGGKLALSASVLVISTVLSLLLAIKEKAEGGAEKMGLYLWLLGVGASLAVFFFMDKDLRDQVQRRREKLRLGYPDLVHKLALYLVAGMSIRSAFGQIGAENEMAGYAHREMQSGLSEQTAYEHFGKRAGVREYVKLSTLLCQNLKKGNRTLLSRLEEEAILSEEARLQSGRKLGEEAETKLLIPMVMLLAMIMLMIMIPAFSMMGM